VNTTQPQGIEKVEKLAQLLLEAQLIANELVASQIYREFGKDTYAVDYQIMKIRRRILDSLDTTPF